MVAYGRSDRVFDLFVAAVLVLVGIASLFPLLYVVSMSVTPFSEVVKNGGFVVIPKAFTLEAYERLFSESQLPRSMGITVILATLGTAVNMLLTVLGAYPLSRKALPGRTVFLLLIVFTMLFSGGMIPTYLIVKNLGMLNTIWALIIPGALATFNMLIMKSFFEGLPEELFESARIDGAGETSVLLRIVIPLSVPSLMTIGLFYMVGNWNTFFAAVLYITDNKLYPLQVVVRALLMASQNTEMQAEAMVPTVTMQMAAVIAASLPVLAVYPFIQKYFTKGMLIGAIKG